MKNILFIAGAAALVAQPFSYWTVTPAIVTSVVFVVLFAIHRYEQQRNYLADLTVMKASLDVVSRFDSDLAKLETKVEEHESKLSSVEYKKIFRG